MNNNLQHHGIKGQKWGVRRFQNKDGSLTAKGEKRYNSEDSMGEKPKKRSKGKRVAIALLKTAGRDTVSGFASAMLIKNGQEAAGKALSLGLGVRSYYKLARDLIDIAKDEDEE